MDEEYTEKDRLVSSVDIVLEYPHQELGNDLENNEEIRSDDADGDDSKQPEEKCRENSFTDRLSVDQNLSVPKNSDRTTYHGKTISKTRYPSKEKEKDFLSVSETSSEKSRESSLTKMNASYGEQVARGESGERWGTTTWQGYKWGAHTWHQHDDEFAPWYDVLEVKHMVTGFRPSGVTGDGGLGRLAGWFSRRPRCGVPKWVCVNPVANRMRQRMTFIKVRSYSFVVIILTEAML